MSVAIVVLGLALAFGSALTLSLRALNQSQHNWCNALELLTSHPVAKPANPAADPSRQENYQFYLDLRDLQHRFGC